MTYISKSMQLNFNTNNRRFNGSSKSWVRVPVTALKVGNIKSLLSHNSSNSQSSFNTSSSRKYRKVFSRNFRNKFACRNFMRDLNKRFYRRFNRNISFKINLRGNKILYFNKPISKEIN